MDQPTSAGEGLGPAFERLGRNLRRAMHAAWETEERKKVTQELEAGMKSLGKAIERAAAELAQSETARRLRDEVEEVAERLQAGEWSEKMQAELERVLEDLNSRLEAWLEGTAQSGQEGSDDG